MMFTCECGCEVKASGYFTQVCLICGGCPQCHKMLMDKHQHETTVQWERRKARPKEKQS